MRLPRRLARRRPCVPASAPAAPTRKPGMKRTRKANPPTDPAACAASSSADGSQPPLHPPQASPAGSDGAAVASDGASENKKRNRCNRFNPYHPGNYMSLSAFWKYRRSQRDSLRTKEEQLLTGSMDDEKKQKLAIDVAKYKRTLRQLEENQVEVHNHVKLLVELAKVSALDENHQKQLSYVTSTMVKQFDARKVDDEDMSGEHAE